MDEEGRAGGALDKEGSGGGFQYVARKSKANRRRRKGKEGGEHDDEIDNGASKLSKRLDIIAAHKAFLTTGVVGASISALLQGTFASKIQDEWPSSILALGLGSVKDSRAAQTQLAFLLLVREKLSSGLQQEGVKVEAYDPIFDDEDRQLLAAHKIETGDTNVQGRYTFDHPVFVFMPHCTKTLYENFLRSNWTPTGLNRLWLCCNDLERYVDDTGAVRGSITPCIKRIVARLSVHRLPALPSSHSGALNDLAMQRYCPPSRDPVEQLGSCMNRTTLRDNDDHRTGDDNASFFELPEAPATAFQDPELL